MVKSLQFSQNPMLSPFIIRFHLLRLHLSFSAKHPNNQFLSTKTVAITEPLGNQRFVEGDIGEVGKAANFWVFHWKIKAEKEMIYLNTCLYLFDSCEMSCFYFFIYYKFKYSIYLYIITIRERKYKLKKTK